MKRGPGPPPLPSTGRSPSTYATLVQDAKYACACPRGASVTRPAVRPSRRFSPSRGELFFLSSSFSLPGLPEPSASGHPSWILMDGDSRTRGRIPADADPQEGRMRAEKIAAWGGINFRRAFLPALLLPFSCGFFRNASLGVNVYTPLSQKKTVLFKYRTNFSINRQKIWESHVAFLRQSLAMPE